MKGRVDYAAARELLLYIENDGDLYRQQYLPIDANLKRKIKRGVFDKALAVKLFMYLADNGAKKYVREFGDGRSVPSFARGWNVDSIFNKKTRFYVAAQLFRYWMDERRIEGVKINPPAKLVWNKLTVKQRAAILWEGGLRDAASALVAAKLRGEQLGPKAREIAIRGAKKMGLLPNPPLAFHRDEWRPYCENCGQWQSPALGLHGEKLGFLDCHNECARRGFAKKTTRRKLNREAGH